MQEFKNVKADSALSATADDKMTGGSSSASAVSWPAILAGGVVAAAVSLVLLILGSGLGFAVASPWSQAGHSMTALTIGTVIWLIITQWASAGIGGFLTGRLRTRWLQTHPHEVFFRDTAHGFLMWCLASLFTAACLAAAVSSVVGGGVQAAATVAAGKEMSRASQGPDGVDKPLAYYVDTLFRKDQPVAAPAMPDADRADRAARDETSRILVLGIKDEKLADNDWSYLVQLVAARTGVAQDVAETRVNAAVAQISSFKAKTVAAAEAARKAAASLSVFTALSMFIGAFIACIAAALGGKYRDDDV